MRTAILDDRLLIEEILVGLPPQRSRPALATTAYWYYRASRAATAGAGGYLSGPFESLPADLQAQAITTLLQLPEHIALPDPRKVVPTMARLAIDHPKLNLLNLDAIATARVLDGELWLSEANAAGVLPAALDEESIPWRVVPIPDLLWS